MSRALKPQTVKSINHQSGIRYDIMLDRNDLEFFATFGTNTERAKSADEVRQQMNRYLDTVSAITWIPVISVKTDASFHGRARGTATCQATRYYVGQRQSGDWVSLDWDELNPEPNKDWGETNVEAARIRRARSIGTKDYTKLPILPDERRYQDSAILAYDEETWNALVAIEQGLEAMAAKLQEIIKTPDGRKLLAKVGASMQKLLK